MDEKTSISMVEKYKFLLGMTRQEVISTLGQEFNYLHSDTWSYDQKKSFIGYRYVLYVIFEKDIVTNIYIKKK